MTGRVSNIISWATEVKMAAVVGAKKEGARTVAYVDHRRSGWRNGGEFRLWRQGLTGVKPRDSRL